MMSVLICSHDDAFRSECSEALMLEGFEPHSVSNEDDVTRYLEDRGQVDLVIMNAERPDDAVHRVLDYLAQVKPHVSVLLSCDSFNYWDDFFLWLADCCLVTPENIGSLKESVKKLVAGKATDPKTTESGSFAVDWS